MGNVAESPEVVLDRLIIATRQRERLQEKLDEIDAEVVACERQLESLATRGSNRVVRSARVHDGTTFIVTIGDGFVTVLEATDPGDLRWPAAGSGRTEPEYRCGCDLCSGSCHARASLDRPPLDVEFPPPDAADDFADRAEGNELVMVPAEG